MGHDATHPHCGVCGTPRVDHDTPCTARQLDVERFCTRCGRRLDVQVLPTSVVATCRRCDGVHPARRGTPTPPSDDRT